MKKCMYVILIIITIIGAIIIGNYSNNQLVCKKDACIIKSGDFSETYSLPDFFEAHFAVIVPKT